MPTHFLSLPGATTLPTPTYQLATRIVDDLVDQLATGVIHGPAGTGKTFAVDANLERLRDAGEHRVVTCSPAFPSKPTSGAHAITVLTSGD